MQPLVLSPLSRCSGPSCFSLLLFLSRPSPPFVHSSISILHSSLGAFLRLCLFAAPIIFPFLFPICPFLPPSSSNLSLIRTLGVVSFSPRPRGSLIKDVQSGSAETRLTCSHLLQVLTWIHTFTGGGAKVCVSEKREQSNKIGSVYKEEGGRKMVRTRPDWTENLCVFTWSSNTLRGNLGAKSSDSY